MDPREHELCRKLLVTRHLSVLERRELPGGRARFSVLVAVVQQALADSNWFPRELEADQDIGDGGVLESRRGKVWVHEQHEVGVSRYSPVRSFEVADVSEGVRAYVDATGGAPIDGVGIDWSG